jgi:PKD repeat protein
MNLINHTKTIKHKPPRLWLWPVIAFILLSILGSTDAKASCTARFTYSVSANAVTFYDSSTFSSTGKHTYTWIWGDGTSNGSGTNPTHKYAHYDTTYHVCLAIYDSATGCRDTICKYVKTNGICTAQFTYSISGKTVSVKSTSTSSSGNIRLHWLFKRSGGSTIDQAHNVTSYSYTLPYYDSSYYVCLSMYDTVSNCSDTKCTSIKAGTNPASKACNANFTYTVAGDTVTFTDSSKFSTSGFHIRSWSFGDGKTAGGTSISHVYPYYDSTFHVCLSVYDSSSGCGDTICKYITTGKGKCSAGFTDSVSGKTVYFKSTSTSSSGNIKLLWYFDHWWGTGIAKARNVTTYSYTFPNYDSSYLVCLTMHDSVSNCSNTKCITIKTGTSGSSGTCKARFKYSVSGRSISFTDSSSYASTGKHYITWIYGDGNTGTGSTASHTYTYYDSTYHVCLAIKDSTTGCRDTVCMYIKTGKGSCYAYFTDSIVGKTVYFKNHSSTTSGAYNLTWTFGDGTTAHNTTAISHTYASFATSYGVCLTVTDSISKCSNGYCVKVITGSASGGCRAGFKSYAGGNTIYFTDSSSFASTGKHSYTWLFGDGTTGTGYPMKHAYALYGTTYHACLAIYDSSTGCRDTFCASVTTEPGNCKASFTDSISGKTVYFTNTSTSSTSTYKLKWSFGDGTVAHNVSSYTHTFPNYDSTYHVCLTITDSISNCSDTYCANLKMHSNGTAGCTAYFSWTDNGSGQIQFKDLSSSASGKHTVSWSFGDKGTSTAFNPTHTYTANGLYYVCLTIKDSAAGCTNTYCDSVYVQACYASFGFNYKNGSLVYNFTDQSSTKYPHSTLWTFGDGTSSTAKNPTHTYSRYGQNITVCLTVKDSVTGCTSQYCSDFKTSCKLAIFAYTVNKRTVTFTNASNSTQYIWWSFGDSRYDSTHLHSVSHTYTGHDTIFHVCLYTRDSNYCSADTCLYIKVPYTPCDANFTYSINDKTVDFKAFDSSHASADYSWEIGDETKHGSSTSFTFSSYDSVTVCLTVTDTSANCSAHYCASFKLIQPTYCISGDVYANKNSAGSGKAYLITYDPMDSSVTAIDTESLVVDTAGTHYKFCGLTPGTYYVKAALDTNSINYSDYVPTYYEKHEKWKQADSIVIVSSDQTGKDIKMKKGHNSGGNGFISGTVYKGAGKNGDPVPGLEVLLYDMDGNIIDYTYSDINGHYQFQYLPYDKYEVWPEVAGLTTVPGFRTLNDSNSSVQADIVITPTQAIVKNANDDIKQSLIDADNASIYPNPVYNNMYVKLHSSAMQQARIMVYDMTGKVAYNQTEMLQPGDQTISIDTKTLPSGLYMMQVQMGHDSHVLQTKFIKAQ